MSALNGYFHVEFEMRTAEEELLVRKQGNMESVRDFIAQLMYLARKAYGQDIAGHREWAAWLVDRLTGKLQAALLNLTTEQHGNWAALMSALNGYFHVEFEMRMAEEKLLVRK
jgi:hypothetical protein